MFYVDLAAGEDTDTEDEISRSIKEIHQSAQKLSDNIERSLALSNNEEQFVSSDTSLSYCSSDAMSGSTETVIEGSLVPLPSFDSNGRLVNLVSVFCSSSCSCPFFLFILCFHHWNPGTCKDKSSTLKSNFTDGDFDTPPETPDFASRWEDR